MKKVIRRAAALRSGARDLAYSAPVRAAVRSVMSTQAGAPVRRVVDSKGLDGAARRLMSEKLPAGAYYAKLTIHDWERHRGRSFRLSQGPTVVYGNEIEPPARGSALEYRNIIVTSKDTGRFSLDIDAAFTLKIGHGAFTTPQQIEYDEKYGVEQHGDVFYSVRGNTTNPSKLLVTFPGFGPSTSRISYAVSYLKDLDEHDLSDTLMVCFQDRYLVSGSYMLVDNGGRPLYDRVHRVIDEFVRRHEIAQHDVLFFGASKGGSIAITYAKEFPQAHLLLAVPQMNLPYYFNKPFFKDSLFRMTQLRELEQPQELVRRYFAEGRKIDYFYTNDDELSNHSLIELAHDVENLTKYRVGGVHGAVAKNALPAMLGVMRRFLAPRSEHALGCVGLRTFVEGDSVRLQLRLDDSSKDLPTEANSFVEGRLGRTRFLQILSDHDYPFVKYMDTSQRLFPAYDRLVDIDRVTVLDASGDRYSAPLPEKIAADGAEPADLELTTAPLQLETDGVQEYAVVDDTRLGRFRYRSARVAPGGDTLEVHVASTLDAVGGEPLVASSDRVRFVAHVAPKGVGDLAHLVVLRLVVAAGVSRLRCVIEGGLAGSETARALRDVPWDDVELVVDDMVTDGS
jgi:hypothetical protein